MKLYSFPIKQLFIATFSIYIILVIPRIPREFRKRSPKRKIEDLKLATNLAILYADRGELITSENRKQFSPPIDADTPGDFFAPITTMWHFNLVPGLHRGAF